MGITFALLLQGAFYRGEFNVFAGLVTCAAVLAALEHRRSVRHPSVRLIHYSSIFALSCVTGIVTTTISALANDRVSKSFVTMIVLLVGARSAWTIGSVSPTSREFLLTVGLTPGISVGVLSSLSPADRPAGDHPFNGQYGCPGHDRDPGDHPANNASAGEEFGCATGRHLERGDDHGGRIRFRVDSYRCRVGPTGPLCQDSSKRLAAQRGRFFHVRRSQNHRQGRLT